ncbi:MAG TPA: SRPBCC family protein [Solirubrobacterales bacterium]|nr:SRPBCC family protein [Solirubrobacterales bacterium]
MQYEFLTTWCLEAPRERVWDAIWESERWPQWWRGVVASETLAEGDEAGVGQVERYTWRSRLPYDLDFEMTTTLVDRPHLLEGEAKGELAGVGRWRLFEEDGVGNNPVTAVVYEWNVHTTKPWMNLLAPIARPVFEWNHDWVMRNGGEGLAELLGCRLLVSD